MIFKESIMLACNWLVDVAQLDEDRPLPVENDRDLNHKCWRGAMRGDYSAANKQWSYFCPIWHTGKAVEALTLAYQVTDDKKLLDAARLGADFILAESVKDVKDDDFGLIYAFEDRPHGVNTSAILECINGMFVFAKIANEPKYLECALNALDWVSRKAYIVGEGLFRDTYDIRSGEFMCLYDPAYSLEPYEGRPLLDDATFLKAFRLSGKRKFRDIFFETAERLLRDEKPSGNWIKYGPANERKGCIHPRQAYWWGMPMLDAFNESGDAKYAECALRSAEWYRKAIRHDGGFFRNTYLDFNTDSFGHATSGSACAAEFFLRIKRELGNNSFDEEIGKTLDYCRSMQLIDVSDPNLKGVIVEKVLAPDGSDRHPYYIRDLGTIFYVIAGIMAMNDGLIK